MKRSPSLKRQTRFSESLDELDKYRSASLEPLRAASRKRVQPLRSAADAQMAEGWDATVLEFAELQPRR
jgi:hypothetical protein